MNNLTNHDLKGHWEAIVMKWGNVAANCSDFEAAHKWALKQFTRLVPHGRIFATHLAHRHLSQFAFCHGREEAPAEPEPLRFCSCKEAKPCSHDIHVHVEMPGLHLEDAHGQLAVRPQPGRCTEKLEVANQPRLFRRALRALMASVTGILPAAWRTADVPEHVFRTSRMNLKWHGREGQIEFQVCGTQGSM